MFVDGLMQSKACALSIFEGLNVGLDRLPFQNLKRQVSPHQSQRGGLWIQLPLLQAGAQGVQAMPDELIHAAGGKRLKLALQIGLGCLQMCGTAH